MISNTLYIVWRQCANTCQPQSQTDINLLLTDFIKYADINLTWFNFNIVLVLTPLACILLLQPWENNFIPADMNGDQVKSYQWIMWVLFAAHTT